MIFFSIRLLSVLRGHSFFRPRHNGQWPPNSKDKKNKKLFYSIHHFFFFPGGVWPPGTPSPMIPPWFNCFTNSGLFLNDDFKGTFRITTQKRQKSTIKKNFKKTKQNSSIYKWRPVTFVKTDRNGKHLLECGKRLYFCNFGLPLAKVGPLLAKVGPDPL